MSTRRQALDVPTSGPIVEIEALSEAQQLSIARAIRGEEGAGIVDRALRTPGVRGLVAVPLYLVALLARPDRGSFPTTKEGVLRIFVSEHERAPDTADALRAVMHGCHGKMLTAIAVEATNGSSVVVADEVARRAVKHTSDNLVAQGQLMTPPQPTAVIDALVDHHVLVRVKTGSSISFQHQQFQEFYAAAHAEELMRAAIAGADARRVLV